MKYTIQKMQRPGGYTLLKGDLPIAQFFESVSETQYQSPIEALRLAVDLRRSLSASVAGAEEAPASLNVYPRKGWEAEGIPEHEELIWCKCTQFFICEGHRA